MCRARRNKPLKPWPVWPNKAVAPVRAGVERLFGTMERVYGSRRVRYHGLARNNVQLQVLCAAIDLRRALKLGLARRGVRARCAGKGPPRSATG